MKSFLLRQNKGKGFEIMIGFRVLFFIPFAVAFVISLLATPGAIWLAPKIGAVDIPRDNRRMHTKPMPRFGGMAIFLGVIVSIFLIWKILLPHLMDAWINYDLPIPPHEPLDKLAGILCGGVLIYLVGIVDDLRGLPAKVKFLLQIVCASVVYAFGVRITFFTDHFGVSVETGHIFVTSVISYLLTVIWIVGITNTINLIDGLDGLAAGVATIASFAIAYTSYIHGMYTVAMTMLAVAGGAAGFLPFNFHPAKIFMGDGGSLFLGFLLASVSIVGPVKGATVLATAVPVLVLGVPIFDTAFAILRRLANGRPIMEADKGHLHHRLMAAGLGQRRSVLILYGISGVMAVAAVLFSRDLFLESFGLFLIAANFIYIYITDPSNPMHLMKKGKGQLPEAEENPSEKGESK